MGSLLSTNCGRYSAIKDRPDKKFLEVPQFCSSEHDSKRHFGQNLTFDALVVWNDIPDEVHSVPALVCFRKRLKSYLFKKASQFTLSVISVVMELATAMA